MFETLKSGGIIMIPIIDLHCDTIMALYQNKDKELMRACRISSVFL
jgi:hypothetical protein